jgi:hypothetical protein
MDSIKDLWTIAKKRVSKNNCDIDYGYVLTTGYLNSYNSLFFSLLTITGDDDDIGLYILVLARIQKRNSK